MGRSWFQHATREELHALAIKLAEIDRDRCIQASGLLAWAATGQAPELKPLSASTLANVAQASHVELTSFAERLVKLDLAQAHTLYAQLGYAIAVHDEDFRAWMRERAK